MINFICLTAIIGILYLIGVIYTVREQQVEYTFLDNTHTEALKGFAILTVVWAHKGAQCGVNGLQFIAGIGVSLFLVCSGYGIMSSYRKNGLKFFWRKRIVRVIVPWIIAEIILYILEMHYSVSILFASYSFENMNWYIKYIFAMYMLFYFTCILLENIKFTEKQRNCVIAMIIAVCFIVDTMVLKNKDIPFLHARQMLSFPMGVFLCLYEEKVDIFLKFMRKHLLRTRIIAAIMFGLGLALQLLLQTAGVKSMHVIAINVIYLITNVILTIAILLFSNSLKVLFNNKYLIYTGVISYELFLLHLFNTDFLNGKIEMVLYIIILYSIALGLFILDKKIRGICDKHIWRNK